MVMATALKEIRSSDEEVAKLHDIPGGSPNWDTATLESLSKFITKGSTPTTYGFGWERSGILFLRSECVSAKGLDLEQSMFISNEANSLLKRSQVADGDILMTITGNVGRVVHLANVGVANINQHIARIRISSPRVSANFIFHFLSQPEIRSYYEEITTGQAYPQISLKQVRETLIPLPKIEEQMAIAEALDDADERIVALEQLIDKKRLIKQGAMHELLSGRRRLPGFSGDWALTRLGARGAFFKGSGVRRDQAQSGEFPCIRYGELYTHFDNVIRTFFSRISPEVAASALKLNRGDILFAGSGETKEEIGKCAVLDGADSAYAGGDIVVFRARDDNPIFLAYYLNSTPLQTQKAAKGQGDAVVHISARALSDLELSLPSCEEQEAIAETLLAMDRELEALDTRLEKARQIKQGMMQELLTGRVRLV